MPKAPTLKSKKTKDKGKSVASANWLEIKKSLDSALSKPISHRKKRRKSPPLVSSFLSLDVGSSSSRNADDNSRTSLRSMALALEDKFSDEHRLPGRYLSLDCEMVGVGINAKESSLARVSLVNYYGAVIVDEYVKQRERVVDYRTRWSGIRASDMINAKTFEEVQKTVHDLLDGRILVGHAVYNDLQALLLSHPHRQKRDTQSYAYKFGLSKSRAISLKNLAKQELGIDIQSREHSSVEDARATMAIYRLHKKDWERTSEKIPGPEDKQSTQVTGLEGFKAVIQSMLDKKREEKPPTYDMHRKKRAKTRKGVSSELSTVVPGEEDKKLIELFNV